MNIKSKIKTKTKIFLRDRAAATQGLRIKVYADWQPEFDEALKTLPEKDIFPHELFQIFMKLPNKGNKQLVLITEREEPVALAGLRERFGIWEPVTQWIVPGVIFPVKEGYINRVLPAIGLPLNVAWWRMPEKPAINKWTLQTECSPTYGMLCSEDFESYWNKTSLLRNIKDIRRRCRNFSFKVNAPKTAEWTIRNWELKWRPEKNIQMPDLPERLIASEYLEKIGLYYSLVLYDRDEPVAGATMINHENELVAHCSYRNSKYDRYGVMTHLIYLIFDWAKKMGFYKIDLGGSFDYKKRWAPQDGQKWKFSICPNKPEWIEHTYKLLSIVRKKLLKNYLKKHDHKLIDSGDDQPSSFHKVPIE